jgi:hypothetical protein
MMIPTFNIEKRPSAASLPPEWDGLADCIFQRRAFLSHADRYNPCRQRYYLLWEGGALAAGACVYTLAIDLFTFSQIPSPLHMTVIGLPASVAAPGLLARRREAAQALIRHVLQQERGLILGLNLDPEIDTAPGINLRMLPSVAAELPGNGWDGYQQALRAPYRRRLRQALERFDGIQTCQTACTAFTPEHHQLYLQVMRRAASKLETLSCPFFRNLPDDDFYLTTYYFDEQMLGWHICARDGNALYFFFGGHDYRLLQPFQFYFNNLYGIIREALHGGFQNVELGQTAEIPKLKAGGQLVPKRLFLYHRNRAVMFLIQQLRRWIEYRKPIPDIRALRGTALQPATNNLRL